MSPVPEPSFKAIFRMATAWEESATRCSSPVFMRFPGIIQRRSARLISSQTAPRTSPDLAPVRMRNTSASLVRIHALEVRMATSTSAISECGTEG